MQPTTASFAAGTLTERTGVIFSEQHAGQHVVIIERTPFHPVDHTWPDQQGDTGTIASDSVTVNVIDTVMVAFDAEGKLAVGEEIPVKRGAAGWQWHVGQIVDSGALAAGEIVNAQVDASRRAALSRGHTACHLASLALDDALADLWRKDPGVDPLGNPNFEARANATSRIDVTGSVDTYRLGKSLRKAGFDTEGLASSLAQRQAKMNETLMTWVDSAAKSWIDVEGEAITDRRTWRCDLPEGHVEFLCGGTHVHSLAEFNRISVELNLDDPQLLVMTTTVTAA